MKKSLLLSLALTFTLFATAQEKFEEGKITMSQTLATDNAEMQGMLEQMMGGKALETTCYIKGNKSRTEINNPMSGDIVTISDMDKKQMLLLMDNPMVGKKYTLTSISAEQESIMKDNVTLVEGTETKTILGYKCKQQLVTINQNGVKMEMELFVTDKIVPVMSQQTSMLGDKLKGFAMYMVMKMNQQGMAMTITTEVTKLEKETVADGKFSLTVPEGYSKIEGQ